MPVFALVLAASTIATAQMPGQKAPGPPPEQIEQTSHGIHATAGSEVLEITVCSDLVIHVVASPGPSAPTTPRPWMLDAEQSCPGAPFTFAQDAKTARVKTARLDVIVNIERGNISFRIAGGESLLNEGNSIPRTYEPVELNGDQTYSITEALYGLGQHQAGILVSYDKLRYRLMPYLYSMAWKVTSEDYTIQRPLVMEWRTDPNTWDLGDEFMFGPAILVNPVLKANATRRGVYLPEAAAWYDFWTGKSLPGGQEIEADAPLERIPLFVRAGSIIPMGPQIECATQDSTPSIPLRRSDNE